MSGADRVRGLAGLVACALVAFASASAAHAMTTYEYVGNPYTRIFDADEYPGTYTRSMFVYGALTFDQPLAPSTVYDETSELRGLRLSLVDHRFGDGRHEFANFQSTFSIDYLATDATGNIVGWYIRSIGSNLAGFPVDIATTHMQPGQATIDYASICPWDGFCDPDDTGEVVGNPGSWTVVPEPGTGLLLVGGLALLARSRRGQR